MDALQPFFVAVPLTFCFGGIMYERSCIVIANLESTQNKKLLNYDQTHLYCI